MPQKLTKDYFDRPADVVARALLGCTLCVKQGRRTVRVVINETEAYMGSEDLACHAAKGRTPRTEIMFREAGTIYVYLVYGMYDMLNVVTGPRGHPAAVLIRGAGQYDGPGKLTKALNITRAHNGASLGGQSGLWIETRKGTVDATHINATPRIGVSYAREWADAKLRFILDGYE